MKNFIQPGKVLTILAPYDVLSGAGAQLGSIFGVVETDALSGAVTEIMVDGVFDLKKIASQAWAVGDMIYWDNSLKQTTKVSVGNRFIGFATKVVGAGAGELVGRVRIGLPGSNTGAISTPSAGGKIAAGQLTTTAATDTVVTGLATVVSVVASLDDDPVAGLMHVSATIGDQVTTPVAGSIIVKGWKSTDATALLVAATTFTKKVNWIAFGT